MPLSFKPDIVPMFSWETHGHSNPEGLMDGLMGRRCLAEGGPNICLDTNWRKTWYFSNHDDHDDGHEEHQQKLTAMMMIIIMMVIPLGIKKDFAQTCLLLICFQPVILFYTWILSLQKSYSATYCNIEKSIEKWPYWPYGWHIIIEWQWTWFAFRSLLISLHLRQIEMHASLQKVYSFIQGLP